MRKRGRYADDGDDALADKFADVVEDGLGQDVVAEGIQDLVEHGRKEKLISVICAP